MKYWKVVHNKIIYLKTFNYEKNTKVHFTGYPAQYARVWWDCMPVNVPSKCVICLWVLWPIGDNKKVIGHSNQFPAIFSSYFWLNVIAPLLSVRRREITQVHLLGTLTGLHSRTQWCIPNKKSLGSAGEARGPKLSGFAGTARWPPGSLPSLVHNACLLWNCTIHYNRLHFKSIQQNKLLCFTGHMLVRAP